MHEISRISSLNNELLIEFPFDLDQFRNLNESVTGYLYKDRMNNTQLQQYNRISTHLRNLILQKFERDTAKHSLNKTSDSYCLYMRCKHRNSRTRCSSIFIIRQKMKTKETFLSFKTICDHSVSKSKSDDLDELITIEGDLNDSEGILFFIKCVCVVPFV